MLLVVTSVLVPVASTPADAATVPPTSAGQTFPAQSLIIDVGVLTTGQTQQTVNQAMRPYGLLYQFLVTRKIPVYWIIADGKTAGDRPNTGKADPVDFTAPLVWRNGVGAPPPLGSGAGAPGPRTYRSGAFVVSWDDLRGENAAALTALLATWRAAPNNVVVDVAQAPFTAPSRVRLTSFPRVVLDAQNGQLIQPVYTNAGIPATQTPAVPAGAAPFNTYIFKNPSALTVCDDVYVMPHADPTWATHNNLLTFNNNGGAIWAGCHAVNVLENIDSPADADVAPNLNFLTTTGMVPHGSHANGSPPYGYTSNGSDPVLQFLGTLDAATLNGSEQIYLPKPGGGWRPTTNLLVTDPTQADVPARSPGPAAVAAYGRGFGNPTNGLVMYEGGHSLAKGTVGDGAAQRAYLNFTLLAGAERAPEVHVTAPPVMGQGQAAPVSATVAGQGFSPATPGSYTWTATCPGTFAAPTGSIAGPGTISTTFTPTGGTASCSVKLVVTDGCGRVTFDAAPTQVVVPADLSITKVDSPDPIAAGGELTYTVTITNGLSPGGGATGITVTDTFPVGAVPKSAQWSGTPPPGSTCTISAQRVTCTYAGILAAGASASVVLRADVLPSAPSPLLNAATVSATNDLNPANDTATATTTVVHPAIALDKTVSPSTAISPTLLAADDFDTPQPPCTPTSANCGTGWASGTWSEQGETNGWTSNDIRVITNFSGTANTVLQAAGNNKSAYRAVNLSPAAGVTSGVTISWSYVRDLGGGRSATVELCNGVPGVGGTACTVLRTYPAGKDTIAVNDSVVVDRATFDVFLAGGSTLRIHSASGNGGGDKLYVDNIQIKSTSTPVTYTFTVTNPGDTPLSAVAVTDDKCSPISGPAGDTNGNSLLEPAETWTYTCGPVFLAGATTNIASVTGVAGGATVSGGDSVHVPVVSPGIAITKSPAGTAAAPAQIVPSGGTAHFVIVVTNTGDTALTAITVSDPGTTCATTIAYLAPGDSHSYSCTKSAITVAGFNIATVTASPDVGGPPVNATSNPAYYAVGPASLTVSKTSDVPTGAHPGDSFLYTVTVTNTGATDQSNISLTDLLPPGISSTGPVIVTKPATQTSQDAFTSGNYSGGTGWNGPWTESEASPATPTGGRTKIDNHGAPQPGLLFDPNNQQYSVTRTMNLAGYTAATLSFACSRETFTAGAGLNDDRLVVSVSGQVVATIDSTTAAAACPVDNGSTFGTFNVPVPPAALVPGASVQFTVTGDRKAYIDNVSLAATAPGPIQQPAGDASNLTGAGGPYHLAPGSSFTFTIPVTVDPAIPAAVTSVTNQVQATSSEQPVPSIATADVPILTPGIAVAKVASTDLVRSGTTVTYTYTVTNTGNTALSAVGLTDDRCAGVTGPAGDANANSTLDRGEIWTYTCAVALVGATGNPPSDPDLVVNTATVTGTDPAGVSVGGSDTATVEVLTPAIDVAVAASAPKVHEGDDVTFTYTVTNTGNDRLASVDLTDPACAPIGGFAEVTGNGDGYLDPGEVWTYRCVRSTSGPADLLSTPTVIADPTLGPPVTDTDSEPVEVIAPHLTLAKVPTAPGGDLDAGTPVLDVAPGTTVTFELTVTNDGDDPLADVAVSDPGCNPDVLPVGPLAPGQSVTVTCTVVATDDIQNTAGAEGTDSLGAPVPAAASAAVNVAGPKLDTAKTAPPTAFVGSEVTTTFTVFNSGETDFAEGDLTISDSGPGACAPLALVDRQGGDTDTALEPGEAWVYECTQTLTAAMVDPVTGFARDTFGVSGTDENGLPYTAPDAPAEISAVDPQILVTKVADDTLVAPGEAVTYTYTVENASPYRTTANDLDDVTVIDDRCAVVTGPTGDDGDGLLGFVEDPADPGTFVPEQWIFTCTTQITADTTNTATASGAITIDDETRTATDTDTAFVEVESPALDVDKSASPTSVAVAGQPVTYTVIVENVGNVPLTAVAIDDTLCPPAPTGGDTNGNLVLDVGETWSFSCTYVTTQADIDAGSILNTATVTATEPGGGTVDGSDTATVTAATAPHLTVAKEPSTPTVAVAGAQVTYTITATNDGNVTLADPVVDDTLCTTVPALTGGDTDGDGDLDVGETWTWTCTYTVTQADIDDGAPLVNTATVTGTDPAGEPVSDTDTAQVTVEAAPHLTVTKVPSVTTVDQVGDPITYTVTVANDGNLTLTDPVVDDSLCTLAFVDGDADGDGDLDVGESWTFTCTYTVTQTDLDAGQILNVATAVASTPSGGTVSGTDDITVTADADAHLSVEKTPSPTTVDSVGDEIVYTIAVTNDGERTLDTVSVLDPMCPPPRTAGDDGDDLLEVGETWFYSCTHVVTQADLDSGSILNAVVVTALDPDGNPVGGGDTATVTPGAAPHLTVVKEATPTTVNAQGDLVTYTVAVTNDGNLTLSAVSVTDPICTLVFVDGDTDGDALLDVGETWNHTCTYTVTQDDMDAGAVLNTATAAATDSHGGAVSGSDAATVQAPLGPHLTLDKVAPFQHIGILSLEFHVDKLSRPLL